MSYLGVFLQIKNEGEEADAERPELRRGRRQPSRLRAVETSRREFTLDVGATVPPEGVIPEPDTVAAAGPTQGALILFLVDDDVSEERPLELEIESRSAATGTHRARHLESVGVDEGLSQSALRTALVLASIAAVVILAGLFSDVVRYVCVGVIVLAALVTASERSRQAEAGGRILGAGAALSAIGAGVAQFRGHGRRPDRRDRRRARRDRLGDRLSGRRARI